ncbi:YciI family protein [Pseudomonas sp. BN411]|uniref:YciI family protein n=1 Tax=Pseudomonas sp. BN411 TaxID=2567887 RepID=UPI00245511DD|nr:YciI family protein [Pseudomonas sp. BN411]MDH4564227.1 YciI family protein [Pseudomonas sp. BN411]
MLFAIHCLDNPKTPDLREKNYDAHRGFLTSPSLRILMAGPLLDEVTKAKIGSLLVVEAETKEQVLAFHKADPFAQAGVWKDVSIHEFIVNVGDKK